jgi:hypothetical protein
MSADLKEKKDKGFILSLDEEKRLEEWLKFSPKGGVNFSEIEGMIRQSTNNPLPKKSRGLGDTIAKVTSKLGIKQCGGCKKRQEKLNKFLPYK